MAVRQFAGEVTNMRLSRLQLKSLPLLAVLGLASPPLLRTQTPQPAQTPPSRGPQRAPQGPRTFPDIHDPVMAKQGDTYYAFGTGNGIRVLSSKDMKIWQDEPPVFKTPPTWVKALIPDFRNSEWAPDIYLYKGTYYLYYAVSSFGRNNSAIGVATNTTLDSKDSKYEWVDRGMVVKSVPGRDMWNAIDANVFHDQEGKPWLSFGSFWGGMKLARLKDNLTELADPPEREWHTIAARERYWKLDERDAGDSANPELKYDVLYPKEVLALNQTSENGAIEAPFVFQKNGWYYLFVSWDRCCKNLNSTYKIVVGRSKKVTGPYTDRADRRMDWGGGTLVVHGVSTSKHWVALGHNSTYTFDGVDYLVFHAYDKTDNGRSKLVIKKIDWDAESWPTVTLDE
jgi:arabinan endo-1,5-alpha-L-arabinosidase